MLIKIILCTNNHSINSNIRVSIKILLFCLQLTINNKIKLYLRWNSLQMKPIKVRIIQQSNQILKTVNDHHYNNFKVLDITHFK